MVPGGGAGALQARLRREPDLGPVSVACSAGEARALLMTSPPAVAVLDVALGDGSGIELAAHIREVSPETRVLMLSAVESVESIIAALGNGARGWLPKTVDSDHLVRVIRGVLRGEAWLAPDLLGRVLTDLFAPVAVAPPDPLAALT